MSSSSADARSLYKEKASFLSELEITPSIPLVFYRDLFPLGSFEPSGDYSAGKGNGMLLQLFPSKGGKDSAPAPHPINRIIFDDLAVICDFQGKKDVLISPLSYFGKRKKKENARMAYAITIDLDYVGRSQLQDLLHQAANKIVPLPTYIVNSGSGLHLYYIFEEPIPLYPNYQRFLYAIKTAVTMMVWNDFTSGVGSKGIQFQGITQGYRAVGSLSKLGKHYPVTAYKVGSKITPDYLLSFIKFDDSIFPISTEVAKRASKALAVIKTPELIKEVEDALCKEKTVSLKEAEKLWPDWYKRRIIEKEPPGHWKCSENVYNWWLKRISNEINVGHRYHAIFALGVYAVKCDIPLEKLRSDAYSLLEHFDALSVSDDNRFTKADVEAALKVVNDKKEAVRYKTVQLSRMSGIEIKNNKRNHRKQYQHLELARYTQKLDGINWREGNGRPSKETEIREYLQQHPGETNKSKIAKDLNLSRPTVTKWMKQIGAEE